MIEKLNFVLRNVISNIERKWVNGNINVKYVVKKLNREAVIVENVI